MSEDRLSAAVNHAAWRDRLLAVLREDVGARDGAAQKAPPPAARLEVLAFHLGEETYGVNIGDVAEILLARPVTPLPRAPDFIRGVVILRGTVLPVVDLARRLGMPSGGEGRSSRILVLRDGEEHMGFWVDRVGGVVRFSQGEVESTEFTSAVDPRFVKGIGYDRKGTLVAVLRSDALCDFTVDTP